MKIDLTDKPKSHFGTEKYRLVRHTHTYTTIRTESWNPFEVTEKTWWLEGPGVYRPAKPEEIDLVTEVLGRVLSIVKPFDEFVNVTAIGSTPYAAIKKEFGL